MFTCVPEDINLVLYFPGIKTLIVSFHLVKESEFSLIMIKFKGIISCLWHVEYLFHYSLQLLS